MGIYVWGTGCGASELLEQGFALERVEAFVDSFPMGETFLEKQVILPQQLDISDCDLLIIDDLGTEMTNNFITSSLFNCINERLLTKKSTIISTNITLDTLADLYTERTFSRITSNYTMLKLYGEDIRLKKKFLGHS